MGYGPLFKGTPFFVKKCTFFKCLKLTLIETKYNFSNFIPVG